MIQTETYWKVIPSRKEGSLKLHPHQDAALHIVLPVNGQELSLLTNKLPSERTSLLSHVFHIIVNFDVRRRLRSVHGSDRARGKPNCAISFGTSIRKLF